MPPGRRRVRCPGCQVGLEEPEEASVYECPVCSILLRAKGPKVHSELEQNPNGDKHQKTDQEKCQLESGNEETKENSRDADHPGYDTKENICAKDDQESTVFVSADENQAINGHEGKKEQVLSKVNSRSNSRGNKVLQELRLADNFSDEDGLVRAESSSKLEEKKLDFVFPETTKTTEHEPYFDRCEHNESEGNIDDSGKLKKTQTVSSFKTLPLSNPASEEDDCTHNNMDNQESYSEFSFPTLGVLAISHEITESDHQIKYIVSEHNTLHQNDTVNHDGNSAKIQVSNLEVDAYKEYPVPNSRYECEEEENNFDSKLLSSIKKCESQGELIDAATHESRNMGSIGLQTLDTQDENDNKQTFGDLSFEKINQLDDVHLALPDGETHTSDCDEVGCTRASAQTQNSVTAVGNGSGVDKDSVYTTHDRLKDGHHPGTKISDTVADRDVDSLQYGRHVLESKMPNLGVVVGYKSSSMNDDDNALAHALQTVVGPAFEGSLENHSYYSDTTNAVVTDYVSQKDVIINDGIVLKHETTSEDSSSDVDAIKSELAECEVQNSYIHDDNNQAYVRHVITVQSDLTSVNDSENLNYGNDSAKCDRNQNTSEGTTDRMGDSYIAHDTKIGCSDILVCSSSYHLDAMKTQIRKNSTTHYSNVDVKENEVVLVYDINHNGETLQNKNNQSLDMDVATHYREFYGYYSGLSYLAGSSEEERETEDNENARQNKQVENINFQEEDDNNDRSERVITNMLNHRIYHESQLKNEVSMVAKVDNIEINSEIRQNDSELMCKKDIALEATNLELHKHSREQLQSGHTDEADKYAVNRGSIDKAFVKTQAEEVMSDAVTSMDSSAGFIGNDAEDNPQPGLAVEPTKENSSLLHSSTTTTDVNLEKNVEGPRNLKPRKVKERSNRDELNLEDFHQQQRSVTTDWILKSENDHVDCEDIYKPADQSFQYTANEENQAYTQARPNVDSHHSQQHYGSRRHPNTARLVHKSEMPNPRTHNIQHQSSQESLSKQDREFTDYHEQCIHPACVLCYPYQHLHVPEYQRLPCAVCLSHLLPMAYHPEPHQHTVKTSPLRNHRPVAKTHKPPLQPMGNQGCHPPFPQRGAMPYVLCKYCNTVLEVPSYFSLNNSNARKLRCGVCLKVTKFGSSKSPSVASIDAASSISVSERSNSVSQGSDHSQNVNQMSGNGLYARQFLQDVNRHFHSQSFDLTQPKAYNATADRLSINEMSNNNMDLRQTSKTMRPGFRSQALTLDTEKNSSSNQTLSSSRNYSAPLSQIGHRTVDSTPYIATPEDYQRYILKGKQKIDESEPALTRFNPYSSNSLESSLQTNHSGATSSFGMLNTLDSYNYRHSRDQISYQVNVTSPCVIEIHEDTLPRTSSISEEQNEFQHWDSQGTSSTSHHGRYKAASINEIQQSQNIRRPAVSSMSAVYTDDSTRSSLLDLFNKGSNRFRLNAPSFEKNRSLTWSHASASSPRRQPTGPYHRNREHAIDLYPAPANATKGSPLNLIKKTMKHFSKGHHTCKVRS